MNEYLMMKKALAAALPPAWDTPFRCGCCHSVITVDLFGHAQPCRPCTWCKLEIIASNTNTAHTAITLGWPPVTFTALEP